MGRFNKLRKNNKYDYNPRYYEDKGESTPFKIEHKFDKFRSTVETPKGIKARFSSALADYRREGDKNVKIRFLIIFALLILLVLFILDFDLSIFFPQ